MENRFSSFGSTLLFVPKWTPVALVVAEHATHGMPYTEKMHLPTLRVLNASVKAETHHHSARRMDPNNPVLGCANSDIAKKAVEWHFLGSKLLASTTLFAAITNT